MKPTFRPIHLAVLTLCLANGVRADETNPSPQPSVASTGMAAPTNDLLIPAFSRGKLRVEVDASDGDVLGVVKSFFEGINPQTLKALAPTGTSAEASAPVTAAAELSRVLSQTDMRSLLANVKHVHLVAYELPYTPSQNGMVPLPPIGSGGALNHKKPATPVVSPAPPTAAANAKFFVDAFTGENARTVADVNLDYMQFVIMAFPKNASENGGFAIVEADFDTVFVFRSDGYPNFSGLGAISAAQLSVFLQQLSAAPGH